MNGRTPLRRELPESVSGAISSATTSRTPVASQTGTKPEPATTLLTAEESAGRDATKLGPQRVGRAVSRLHRLRPSLAAVAARHARTPGTQT